MANITKHDSEQERENCNGEESRVYLFVSWHTIGINNLLERSCEVIGLEESWWLFECCRLSHGDNVGKSELKHSSFVLGHPNLSDHGASWLVIVFNHFKHVQSVVDQQLFLD